MRHKFPFHSGASATSPFSPASGILALIALLATVPVRAQEILVQPRLSFGSDFQLGLRLGVGGYTLLGDAVLTGFLDGEVRPISHAVRIKMTPTLDHQYRETRYSVGPGFSISQPLGEKFALNSGAGFAYTEGDYAGSNRKPAAGWKPWAEAGVSLDLGRVGMLGTALQLRPLPEIAPVRLLIQYSWRWR
jgi:hypothetical protein